MNMTQCRRFHNFGVQGIVSTNALTGDRIETVRGGIIEVVCRYIDMLPDDMEVVAITYRGEGASNPADPQYVDVFTRVARVAGPPTEEFGVGPGHQY